jgi:Tfp pilus assembly protein PilN
MAVPKKTRKEINFLVQEEWEKRPAGRTVKWALTIGRHIVIITELVVIIAFVFRFKLDRNLSDLYEEIEVKRSQIEELEEFENEFRTIQNRLKTINELEERRKNPQTALSQLASLVPLNVTFNKLEIGADSLSLSGYSLSESGLATLINNLNQSLYFDNIELGNISKSSSSEISFTLSMELNPE